MEKQLFEWESYDIIDDGIYVFNDVTLKIPVGNLPAGSKFDFANLSFLDGILELGMCPEGGESKVVNKVTLKLIISK